MTFLKGAIYLKEDSSTNVKYIITGIEIIPATQFDSSFMQTFASILIKKSIMCDFTKNLDFDGLSISLSKIEVPSEIVLLEFTFR